jgi:hypothetical protein
MKKAILYLFILSLLFNIFQYMNSNKILKTQGQELENAKTRITKVRDSITTLREEKNDSDYFSLDYDDDAQEYFSRYDVSKVAAKVKEDLVTLNDAKTGNRLVPYEPINGNKFIISKIKILNHRWIIADFYSGSARGEVLLKYFYNEDKPTDFERIDAILFANTVQ